MVNSRQKGLKAEKQLIEILRRETQLEWEQTPGSGSGKVKGDLRVHGKHNIFCVEVKFYKEVGFNAKLFTQKSNNLFQWWSKVVKQAQDMEQEPLLIFRENYGKWYVATTRKPTETKRYMHVAWLGMYILLLDNWLDKEKVEFTNGDYLLRPWEPCSDWELADS